jgi:hypothetical protein
MLTRTLYRRGKIAMASFRGIKDDDTGSLTLEADTEQVLESMVQFALEDGWRRSRPRTGNKPRNGSSSA